MEQRIIPEKYFYIAVFEKDEEGYVVTYPDIEGCITDGDNINDAISNAKEALALHMFNLEECGEEIPKPRDIEILRKNISEIMIPIEVYMKSTRENLYSKSVSKNVTIPYWLKKLAENEKINFSELLQQAIKDKLNISFLDFHK